MAPVMPIEVEVYGEYSNLQERPLKVHLVLGLENEVLLPSDEPEQPNTEVTEDASNPDLADERVYESTFVTTTIEELPDALLPQSDAALPDQSTTVPPEKEICTDKEAPPPSQEASEPQEAIGTGHDAAPPHEAIPAYQEAAPPQETISTGHEPARPQETISTGHEPARPQETISTGHEPARPQETISTGHEPAISTGHEPARPQETISTGHEAAPTQGTMGIGHEAVQPQEDTNRTQEAASKQDIITISQGKGPSVNAAPDPEVEGAASSEEEEEKESCEQQTSPEDMRRLAENMTAFTIDLLKQVAQESNQPNIVLSPLSISLGLSQLALGAGPETEKKLLQALHIDSSKCLHKKLKSLRKNLGKRLLRLATRMYIRKGFEVKEEFRKRSEGFYGAKPVTLGQSKKQNLGMINSWVKQVTEGRVSEFLSQIPDDLVLLLINAMHFKGIWMTKFNSSLTYEGRFYLSEKQMVPVQMMRAPRYPLSYFHMENIDAMAARLPFKGNMSFVVILPNSFKLDIAKLLDEFNQTEMYSLFKKETPTLLKIPRLHLDFKLELSQALTRLGLGELFFRPDLRGISDEALSVSSVQHQSTLELNEEGVEASAVTSVQESRSWDSFSINQPFVFFLLDDITGMPLFLGCVRNPNPSAPVQVTDQSDSPDKDDKFFMKGYIPK